jgi:hypothetical protein
MSWFAKIFGRRSVPSFPAWLERQANISVQAGLHRFIRLYRKDSAEESPSKSQRSTEELRSDYERASAEVTLLTDCISYHGESRMSPEFWSLLATKRTVADTEANLLKMKATSAAAVSAAMERVSKQSMT